VAKPGTKPAPASFEQKRTRRRTGSVFVALDFHRLTASTASAPVLYDYAPTLTVPAIDKPLPFWSGESEGLPLRDNGRSAGRQSLFRIGAQVRIPNHHQTASRVHLNVLHPIDMMRDGAARASREELHKHGVQRPRVCACEHCPGKIQCGLKPLIP